MTLKNRFTFCLTFLTLIFSTTAQIVQSPIAYYKFDETSGSTASESSDPSLNASINGAVVWTDGYLGGAIELDGTDNNNVVLPEGALDLHSDEGSFAAWIFADEGRIRSIFAGGDNDTGGGFGPENEIHLILELPENNIWVGGELAFVGHSQELNAQMFFIWSDTAKGLENPAVPPVDPTVLDDGEWHHVVSTWGAGYATTYIDGELSAQIAYNPGITPYKFTHFKIGSMLNGVRAFHGKLDEVRIYDGVLSENEVIQLYTNEFYEGTFAPNSIALSETEISENATIGTEVGSFITEDDDLPKDSFTYALISGDNDNDKFEISGNLLVTRETFDVTVDEELVVEVRVTDAYDFTFDQELTITVLWDGVLSTLATEALSIYPNPAIDELSVRFGTEGDLSKMSLEIYSMDGKLKQFKARHAHNTAILDISSLTPGIYVLKIDSGDQFLERSFIKN